MALDLTRTASPPPAKTRATPRVDTKKQAEVTSTRAEGLNGLFQIGAAGCMMAGQYADAGAFSKHGPTISDEAAKLAETNESFAKTLDYITAIGPYAGLLTAVVPFVLQILVNHHRLPAEPLQQLGVDNPAVMEAKMKADMLKQAREALAAQAEAEKAYAAELEAMQGQSVNGAHVG